MADMELVPGDVLLLDPEWIEDKENNEVRQDCISLLICKLDNRPVSHAALYYSATAWPSPRGSAAPCSRPSSSQRMAPAWPMISV